MALEWGSSGVRVVGIAPGPIADTEGMRRLGKYWPLIKMIFCRKSNSFNFLVIIV